jgi:hypothetical protein
MAERKLPKASAVKAASIKRMVSTVEEPLDGFADSFRRTLKNPSLSESNPAYSRA